MAQQSGDLRRLSQCQGKLSSIALQQDLSLTAVDRDVVTEEIWEERCRVGESCGQMLTAEGRELLDEELQQGRREQSPTQQQLPHVSPAAELRKEQQRNRPVLMLRDHRDGRVRAFRFNFILNKVLVKISDFFFITILISTNGSLKQQQILLGIKSR